MTRYICTSTLKFSLQSRLWIKKINETRSYLLEEIKQNDLMCEKNKKTCRALNYFEDFFVVICAVSGCVSISAFASLAGVPVAIVSSAVGLRIYAISVGINKI